MLLEEHPGKNSWSRHCHEGEGGKKKSQLKDKDEV